MGNKGAGNPCGLLRVEAATGKKHMNMHMPGEAPAESVHDRHAAREIVFVGVPINECLIDNRIESIKIWSSANAEVIKEFMGRAENDMLIFTIGKQGRVSLNPRISLSYPTGRAES